MDKKSKVRIVGFPKKSYEKSWLDTLIDEERSETALADGDAMIYADLEEFQEETLNKDGSKITEYWWYFLND